MQIILLHVHYIEVYVKKLSTAKSHNKVLWIKKISLLYQGGKTQEIQRDVVVQELL